MAKYYRNKIYASVVGVKEYIKTYNNNGVSNTVTYTYVNIVYDRQDDHLSGRDVGSFICKKHDISWQVGNYEIDLVTLIDSDGKRSYEIEDARLLVSEDKK